MKLHVSVGNTKIGRIANINLPPIISCKKGVPCGKEKLCYALKAYRQYPKTREAWDENYELAKTNIRSFFDQAIDYIRKHKKIEFFRWHSSGDIINQDYYENMVELARQTPNVKYLAFTKNDNIDFTNKVKNLVIRASFWPNYENNAKVCSHAWL